MLSLLRFVLFLRFWFVLQRFWSISLSIFIPLLYNCLFFLLLFDNITKSVHHSRELRLVAKEDGVFTIVEHTLKHRRLEAQLIQHLLFYRVFGYKIDNLYVTLLTKTIDTSYALFKDGRIPRQIEIDYNTSCLQIQTSTTCIRRKEHATVRVIRKVNYQVTTLSRGYASMQIFVAYTHLVKFIGYQARHTLPLAEDDHLFVTIVKD